MHFHFALFTLACRCKPPGDTPASFHLPERSFTRRSWSVTIVRSISLRLIHWIVTDQHVVWVYSDKETIHHHSLPTCKHHQRDLEDHQNKCRSTRMILGLYLVLILLMLLGLDWLSCVWILLCLCVNVCVCIGMSVLILVALHVQSQVVGAWEAATAGDAFEGFGSGVFPVMSGELVRSGEAPIAVLPCTTVGLLTCKREEEEMFAWDKRFAFFLYSIFTSAFWCYFPPWQHTVLTCGHRFSIRLPLIFHQHIVSNTGWLICVLVSITSISWHFNHNRNCWNLANLVSYLPVPALLNVAAHLNAGIISIWA